ncbi:MAG: NADPH:quinone reductase-like Zn-dependent oxidoreductase [Hyphomicrobiaceae bacterium]|jgi:NADPH:quinone reductase-like Zn-dependent oxidoreductase
MTMKSEAWVLHSGEKGAAPELTELVREDFEFREPGPTECLISPLFGCMEGNMAHAVERKPVDICQLRGEPKVVFGNAGVVRVERVGADVTTVREGDTAIIFCNGVEDPYGYPEKIFAYDAPGTMGVLSKQGRVAGHQLIRVPENSKYPLEQWAAFSLRYITAWSNWELAYGTLRLLLDDQELPRPQVWAWGGGVSLGECALARHYGCDAVQIASTDERLTTIESLGITPVDRREFRDLYFDKKRFRKDEEYTAKYIAAEKVFMAKVNQLTDGKNVNIFLDYVGVPVLRATLKALARQGVLATAGWKEGMMIELVRASECIARHQHINTHYARYRQGVDAVAFAEENGWLPPLDSKVYSWDEVPQMFDDYRADKVGWFPIFRING